MKAGYAHIHFFISNHTKASAIRGKARRITLAGRPKDPPSARLHTEQPHREPTGKQLGPRVGAETWFDAAVT